MTLFEIEDIDACQELWRDVIPQDTLFDLWEVRECFWRHHRGHLLFLVAYEHGHICGLLPLTRTDNDSGWGYFPGETWMQKTWLEQNRLMATNQSVYHALLSRCPANTHLRYLCSDDLGNGTLAVDEIDYVFLPEQWSYSYEQYWSSFSSKRRSRLRSEMDGLIGRGVEIRRGLIEDVELLFEMNRACYGDDSYFADGPFYSGFRDLVAWLNQQGFLEVTTVLVEETVAAVDVSAVYNNACTVLAGGTHRGFPGVAKLMNTAHIRWACQHRFSEVDFLSGDFSWKQRFHLTERPSYQYKAPGWDTDLATLKEVGCLHAG